MAKKLPEFLKKKKDEKKTSKKPKKGVNPFTKKGKKKKLDENLLKFVDMMIAENYSNAHKVLEVVVNNKLKQRIAEAAAKDLFPKAKDNNPNFLKNAKKAKKKKKTSVKNNKKNN